MKTIYGIECLDLHPNSIESDTYMMHNFYTSLDAANKECDDLNKNHSTYINEDCDHGYRTYTVQCFVLLEESE